MLEDEYDDLPDLPSDEETAIMREIRAEITAQVKTEMKSELAVYHNARKKLESPSAAKVFILYNFIRLYIVLLAFPGCLKLRYYVTFIIRSKYYMYVCIQI